MVFDTCLGMTVKNSTPCSPACKQLSGLSPCSYLTAGTCPCLTTLLDRPSTGYTRKLGAEWQQKQSLGGLVPVSFSICSLKTLLPLHFCLRVQINHKPRKDKELFCPSPSPELTNLVAAGTPVPPLSFLDLSCLHLPCFTHVPISSLCSPLPHVPFLSAPPASSRPSLCLQTHSLIPAAPTIGTG